jgi:hypothetical protein
MTWLAGCSPGYQPVYVTVREAQLVQDCPGVLAQPWRGSVDNWPGWVCLHWSADLPQSADGGVLHLQRSGMRAGQNVGEAKNGDDAGPFRTEQFQPVRTGPGAEDCRYQPAVHLGSA